MKKIVYVVLVLIIVAGVFWIYNSNNQTSTPDNTLESNSNTNQPESGSTAGWYKHTNIKFGYSVEYLSNWYDAGTIENDQYFSNEQVGSPLEMTNEGVWLTIRKSNNLELYNTIIESDSKGSATLGLSLIKNSQKIDINGREAYKYTTECTANADTECGYTVDYSIKDGNDLYTLQFFTRTKATSDKNDELYDQVANTFTILE